MRVRWIPAVLTLGILYSALTTSAQAQQFEADPGSKPWWGLGLGAGALHFTCDLCSASRDVGPSAHAVVGAYASPNVLVGLEIGGWSHQDGEVRETAYRAGAVALIYPKPASGFHFVGGLGWLGYKAEDFGYNAVHLSVGAGWDLPLSGGWVVGNAVTIDAASFGTLRNDGDAVVRDVGLSIARFTVTLKRF